MELTSIPYKAIIFNHVLCFFVCGTEVRSCLVVGLDHRFSLQHHPCNVYLSFTTHPGSVSFFLVYVYSVLSFKHKALISCQPVPLVVDIIISVSLLFLFEFQVPPINSKEINQKDNYRYCICIGLLSFLGAYQVPSCFWLAITTKYLAFSHNFTH